MSGSVARYCDWRSMQFRRRCHARRYGHQQRQHACKLSMRLAATGWESDKYGCQCRLPHDGPLRLHRRVATAALPGLLILAGLAHADANEWCLGVAGAGVITKTRTASVAGDALGFGARARLGYGLTNNLELAAEGAFTRTQAVEFNGASIEGQRGDLFADLTTAELEAGVRWTFGVEVWRALERFHPFLGVRAGGIVRSLSGQVLLNAE